MAVQLRHKFISPKSDGIDSTLVQPSNWNDDHDLLMNANRILGRVTAGYGGVEELTPSQALGALGVTAFAQTLLAAADAAAARSVLQLSIGSQVQAWDQTLDALSAVVPVADRVPYFTSATAMDVTALTAYGRSLIGAADANAARGLLGVGGGFTLRAYTASTTWIKPANLSALRVTLVGGGGGGFAGSGVFDQPSQAAGNGGWGGSVRTRVFGAADLPTSVAVTIGAGGTRGERVDGVGATLSGAGGTTSFGALLSATGGPPGRGWRTPSGGTVLQNQWDPITDFNPYIGANGDQGTGYADSILFASIGGGNLFSGGQFVFRNVSVSGAGITTGVNGTANTGMGGTGVLMGNATGGSFQAGAGGSGICILEEIF